MGTTQEDKSTKLKSKTWKGNSIKRIGTWDVRPLLQTGKLENLKTKMAILQIDLLGISKMRRPKSGDFWLCEYRVIYSETEEGRTGTRGICIV